MKTVTTKRGTKIFRYKGLAGKRVGGRIYFHKKYTSLIFSAARLHTIIEFLPNFFSFNCVMYDMKTGRIRLDEAPDFDSAREPRVGRWVSIEDNEMTEGSSNAIWHHKWLWVADDYPGFDVEESFEWSKTYSAVLGKAPSGNAARWEQQLKDIGLA